MQILSDKRQGITRADLISARDKSQKRYRLSSAASRTLRVLFVILDDLAEGHRWIDCTHTIHLLLLLLPNLSEVFSADTIKIPLFIVKINK